MRTASECAQNQIIVTDIQFHLSQELLKKTPLTL